MPSDVRDDGIPNFIREAGQKIKGADLTALRQKFLPAMLEVGNFHTFGIISLLIAVPLGLGAAWNFARAWGRLSDPGKHPAARSLRRYGVPEEVADQIHAESAEPGETETVSGVTLTKTWMLRKTTFGLNVNFLGEAVWAHQSTTQHSTNGIPTGKTYAVHYYERTGAMTALPMGNEPQAQAFLRTLFGRVPWILVGYDAALEKAWKSNRPGVVAAVDGRRQELIDGPSPGAGEPEA